MFPFLLFRTKHWENNLVRERFTEEYGHHRNIKLSLVKSLASLILDLSTIKKSYLRALSLSWEWKKAISCVIFNCL